MSDSLTTHRFTAADASRVIPRRTTGAHKWEVGGLLIVAGSPGYLGAAALSAMAAGRVGAGIVNLAVPRALIGPIATLVPEVAFTAIPDGDLGTNGSRLIESIKARAERCSAFLVGPGLGDDTFAEDVVRALLGLGKSNARSSLGFGVASSRASDEDERPSLLSYERPIVVDADGLNILAGIDDWWNGIPDNRLILTPHVGEMSRLLDATTDDVLAAPDAAAVEASRRFRQTVVLKGSPTIVASGSDVYPAAESPRSLASAGTGDVLAGAIAGLLAQGLTPLDAANLAVHAGSLAALTLESELGELGLVASDLPRAMAIELANIARQ